MNTLSWTLYLLDIYGSVKDSISAFLLLSIFGAVLAISFEFLSSDRSFKSEEQLNDLAKYWRPKFVVAFFVLVPLAVFMPSYKTMTAIIASEVGEKVLMESDLPELKKVRDIINKKLDELNGD